MRDGGRTEGVIDQPNRSKICCRDKYTALGIDLFLHIWRVPPRDAPYLEGDHRTDAMDPKLAAIDIVIIVATNGDI